MQQPPQPPPNVPGPGQPVQPPMRQPGQPPVPGPGVPPSQPPAQPPFQPVARPPMPPPYSPPTPPTAAPPTPPAPTATPISAEPDEASKGGNRLSMVLGGLIAAVILLAVGLLMSISSQGVFAPKLGGGSTIWTAVLLNDGEVFFGHMKSIGVDRVELTTVYYVQKPSSSPAPGAAAQPVSIVSLVANQVQCPKDDIFINRANVLYWEDLQDASYVATRLNSLSQSTPTCFQPSASPSAAASATPGH